MSAAPIMTAFWGMVINNPTAEDILLVQHSYPDHVREIVRTDEQGTEGTPHIQAWLKLQRQQRLSFVKKLYPRANFKALTHDEYVYNTKVYAQKRDDTAVGPTTHTFNDPAITGDTIIKMVAQRMTLEYREQCSELVYRQSNGARKRFDAARHEQQRTLVRENYKNAKYFVQPAYDKTWDTYAPEIISQFLDEKAFTDDTSVSSVEDTHTHTHTEAEQSVDIDIQTCLPVAVPPLRRRTINARVPAEDSKPLAPSCVPQ